MTKGITDNLTEKLMLLPGIGRKTAQRLSFFIMAMQKADALSIASAITELKENARFCTVCFNVSDSDLCPICKDPSRDKTRICVVEEPSSIAVVERSHGFNGMYHVLMGALSPIDGITADSLKIKELVQRVGANGTSEVIIATNPNTKGELTAKFIKDALGEFNVEITRIAYGLPMGGDLEFADEVTLRKSLEGRRRL